MENLISTEELLEILTLDNRDEGERRLIEVCNRDTEKSQAELSKTESVVHSKPEKKLYYYQISPDFPGMVDGGYRPPYPEKKDTSENLEL